jgi:hypothetical protein
LSFVSFLKLTRREDDQIRKIKDALK